MTDAIMTAPMRNASPPLNITGPAVVLGVEHPRGLTVLRSLACAGVPVVVVDRYKYAPGLYSRLAHRKYRLDTDDCEQTLQFLESIEGLDNAVLIPTNDHYLGLVADNAARLAKRFTLATGTRAQLDVLIDKSKLYPLAQSLGISTPVFHLPETREAMDAVLGSMDFTRHGYVFSVSPLSPEPADAETVRFTLPAGPDLATARARAEELCTRTGAPPMIQEVVPGGADCCFGVTMLLDERHRPIGSRAVRRRVLYPYFDVGDYTYGGNVCCESAHDEEAVAVSATLARHVGLTGIVTVEFRRQPPDHRLVLMKIDPRVVGMTGLCTALNFDVPTLIYRLATGQPISVSADYPDGLRWVWEKPYVLGLLERHGLQAWRQIPAAINTFRGASTLGIWSASDPWPFVYNAAGGVRSQVRKRFLRQRGRHPHGPASLR